jgi:hypothetical protein
MEAETLKLPFMIGTPIEAPADHIRMAMASANIRNIRRRTEV